MRPERVENILFFIDSILFILKQFRLLQSLDVSFLKVFRCWVFFIFLAQ